MPLGVVAGEVTIQPKGDDVEVVMPNPADTFVVAREPGQFVELVELTALGTIHINASDIILRDCESLGGFDHGIALGDGVHGVRLVRPVIRGYGRFDPEDGFQEQADSGIRSKASGEQSPYDLLVVGGEIGVLRYPANAWEEQNHGTAKPANPDQDKGGSHPWGAFSISLTPGSYRGQIVLYGLTMRGSAYRTLQDCVGHDKNFTSEIGGLGADSYIGWTVCDGFYDDGFEWDGAGINSIQEHNLIYIDEYRPATKPARAAISVSTPYWGPIDLRRNVFLHVAEVAGGRGLKAQRKFNANHRGVVRAIGNTMVSAVGNRLFDFLTPSYNKPKPNEPETTHPELRHIFGRNNLVRSVNAFQPHLNDAILGNDFDFDPGSNLQTKTGGLVEFKPGRFKLVDDAPDRSAGVYVPNVTDAGPFQTESPNRGAW